MTDPTTASASRTEALLASDPDARERARQDIRTIAARYPQRQSALLPALHLVQSYDGYVSQAGIALCSEELGVTKAEVSGVATFYTMYKRHAMGEFHVGVCTNTLCAVMGGDAIWQAVSAAEGLGHDEVSADGVISLERLECNAACDYAPVVMVNWEFMDNQTPDSTLAMLKSLRAGEDVHSTRGPSLCNFKAAARLLAGFNDGRTAEGPQAGPASLRGVELAAERGWTAPTMPEGDNA